MKKINKREDFPKLLNENKLNGNGIEIGVQKGIYSEVLNKNWNFKKLYLVDCWVHLYNYEDVANVDNVKQNLNYKTVLNKFKDNNKIDIIKGLSVEAAISFEDDYFDFIYLDARHNYDGIMEDLIAWFPKVKYGGIFAGHDFLDGKLPEGDFGVKSAVTDFLKPLPYELNITDEKWPSWYFFKG